MSRPMTATFPTYHTSQRGDDEERQLGNSGSRTALPQFSPLRRSSTNSTLVNSTSLRVPSPRQDKRLSFSAQSSIERRVHAFKSFWSRFNGEGRKHIGVWESLKAIWASTWLNYLFVFIPITWAVALTGQDWFIVLPISFVAIIPLTKFLEYAGEQLALYCGKTLGDLIIVTCCNVVEVVLAIDLLRRCDLRLLQATIIGVTLLHLLLIPGSAFMTGGARVMELTLDKTRTNLNHTLLSIGVLTLLLPAAFFAALDRGALPAAPGSATSITINPVTDAIRVSMVSISRGLAIILLMVYVCSRIFLHNPPAPTALKKVEIDIEILMEEEELAEKEPEVNSWVCLVLLLVCVGITASCTVFLLNSLEILRGFNGIQEEWFGLVLLPFVSFSADAVLALVWYSHHVLKYWFGTPSPTESLASTKSIDASIQFVMFWMPFLVLLGWATGKPMSLLFDLFEVALLLGAAFLVNYVTAGAKTNWGEGASLVAFYSMIALTAFFYSGQPEIRDFLSCTSVASAISNGSTDSILSNAAKEEFANEVIKHFKLHVAA